MQEIKDALQKASKAEFELDLQAELTRPDEKFGDYSSNIAMQLGKKTAKNPREIAILLAAKLHGLSAVDKVEVAGSGFINIKLTDEKVADAAQKATDLGKPLAGQEIVLEHTDPNPFKEFHIGHTYSNTVGIAIGNLLKTAGANVHQVTYQGDVGLHIAMAIYGLKNPDNKEDLGLSYAFGAEAYEHDPLAKEQIETINLHLYKRDDPQINELYDRGRKRSLEKFEQIYQKLGADFEKNYFESDTAKEGIEIVKKNIGKTFVESEEAIIYDGEKAGLHKRVFITKKGLPTYEAKEIGLAFAKNRDYPAAQKFIVITANEIDDYFNVLVAAIKEIEPTLAAKIMHLSHGVVKFPGGKMSSRTGNVKTFDELFGELEIKANQLYGEGKGVPGTVLGAIKYEFLKHRIGSDFVFDVEESISLQGNSGPYLQYAHARASSILKKSDSPAAYQPTSFEPAERSLARKISEYPEVVQTATKELLPSHITTYLYELAQNFNSFYETSRIIGDVRQDLRLKLVRSYSDVLASGLGLLNIAAPDHM